MQEQEKGTNDNNKGVWIDLVDSKHWSRLLYPNPVCFLCTSNEAPGGSTNNVMVLSWLTATNNAGAFVFSLCKRRYTADRLKESFTLSVPVKGMEGMVLQVGGISGREGSKFPSDRPKPQGTVAEEDGLPISKRKRKKLLSTHGVEGLRSLLANDGTELFFIDGTVAHLSCRVINFLDCDNTTGIDTDHRLVLAQVQGARVRSSYWCQRKNLFCPTGSCPPILTFLGSQTFGYVVAESSSRCM